MKTKFIHPNMERHPPSHHKYQSYDLPNLVTLATTETAHILVESLIRDMTKDEIIVFLEMRLSSMAKKCEKLVTEYGRVKEYLGEDELGAIVELEEFLEKEKVQYYIDKYKIEETNESDL